MQVMERSHSATGFFGWFTYERRNWCAVIVLAACAGYAGGNGHTTQGAIVHVSQQLGDAKAKAACEHKVAQKAKAVAKQGILAATRDDVAAPDPRTIPADNCPK